MMVIFTTFFRQPFISGTTYQEDRLHSETRFLPMKLGAAVDFSGLPRDPYEDLRPSILRNIFQVGILC